MCWLPNDQKIVEQGSVLMCQWKQIYIGYVFTEEFLVRLIMLTAYSRKYRAPPARPPSLAVEGRAILTRREQANETDKNWRNVTGNLYKLNSSQRVFDKNFTRKKLTQRDRLPLHVFAVALWSSPDVYQLGGPPGWSARRSVHLKFKWRTSCPRAQ